MLPFINRILITTIHSSTGMSPAEMVFGRSIHLERGILAPLGEEVEAIQKNSNHREYITNMWNSQQTIISKARSNLKELDAKNIAKRLKANEGEVTRFPIHSYVLAEPQNYFTIRKETNKLKTILKGAFKVVAVSDDGAKYTVLNLVTMRLRVYHVSALRTFHARPEDTDLTNMLSETVTSLWSDPSKDSNPNPSRWETRGKPSNSKLNGILTVLSHGNHGAA